MAPYIYPWIKFIHIVAGFTFLMTHGASVALSFRLKEEAHLDYFRKEHHLERIRAYLDLSGQLWLASMSSLVVLVAAGIIAAFLGHWWGRGWIWASIIVLIVMIVWMRIPTREIHELRVETGLPYRLKGKMHPPDEPKEIEEIEHLLLTTHPWLITIIGYGGMVIIIWLMMFKPF